MNSRRERRHLNTTLGTQIKNSDLQNYLKFPQERSPRRLSFCMRHEQKCLNPVSTQQFGVYPSPKPRAGFQQSAFSSKTDLSVIPQECLTSDKSQPGEANHSLTAVLLIPVSGSVSSIRRISLGCRIKSPLNFCPPCEHLNRQTASSCPVLQEHIRGTPHPSHAFTGLQRRDSCAFSPS